MKVKRQMIWFTAADCPNRNKKKDGRTHYHRKVSGMEHHLFTRVEERAICTGSSLANKREEVRREATFTSLAQSVESA